MRRKCRARAPVVVRSAYLVPISDDAFSDDDWAIATAFTNEGLENLKYIIDAIKAA